MRATRRAALALDHVTGGPLIGRDRELAEFVDRIAAQRLVTVVGPGGVGKTSFALVAAEHVAHHFPGVGVIDLARVSDPTAVTGSIATQLGFESFDALLTSPWVPVLIVIDNCEHLLDAAAAAITHMLGASNQQTVIATSRAPLELPGESVVALAPLALPSVGEDPRQCPSVELFLERCRDAGAEVSDDELDTVVELCRMLDGLPLAIEIAAARTRSMTVAEIASRLDDDVQVLDRPRFRGDPRHRSLTTTIAWSHDLLDPPAARLLEQLSVFSGSFSASDARAVAATDDDLDASLDDLVHASLVVADTAGSEARFRLLDTVRRFAFERLDEHGGVADAFDRFVDLVVARANEIVGTVSRSWRVTALDALVSHYDDIARALGWCIEHDDTPERAYRCCEPLVAVAHQAHSEQIAALMRRLLTRFPDGEPRGRTLATAVLATAEYGAGEPAAAVEIACGALAEHREGDLVRVLLLRVLGRARHALGDNEQSHIAFTEGAQLARELGVDALADELGIVAAVCDADAGRVHDALADIGAIVDAAQASGSPVTANWASATRSWVEVRVDADAALAGASAALVDAQELGVASAVAVSLRSKAFAQLILGDRAAASTTVEQLVDHLLAGGLSNLRMVVDAAAAVAYRSGHENWPRLVATARALPITTPVCSRFEVVSFPAVSAEPFPRHTLINTVGTTMVDIAAECATDVDAHATTGSIRAGGQFWEVEFDGRAVLVRASKGMATVVHLLMAAGREIHCTELAGVDVAQSSTGDVIDAAARRKYEARIRELQSEIDAAEGDVDFARTYQLHVELDALVEHLSASLGRGQQTRRNADSTERARSAITHRLRTTIRQLEKVHPTLGRHLDRSVKTGTYCSYRPERPVTWTVQ